MKKITIKSLLLVVVLASILSINIFAAEDVLKTAPEITSKSNMLVDMDSGAILYQNNIDASIYPASTTKILTAIIVIENTSPSEMVSVTDEALVLMSGASLSGLISGESMSVDDMLYCLLLPSGNDAANALAIHVAGSIEAFTEMMNTKAKSLGALDSNFANPHGLHDENHYTTARDISIIAQYALENDYFCKIVSTTSKTLDATNKNSQRTIYSSNSLIKEENDFYYEYASGVKTGFTTPAGTCLVSSASKSGKNLLSLVFGGTKLESGENTVFADSVSMLEWGFDNFKELYELQSEDQIQTVHQEKVSINADAYMIYGKNSDNVIASKNMNEKIYPADTTKILTALLVIENANMSDVVTITEDAFYNIGY